MQVKSLILAGVAVAALSLAAVAQQQQHGQQPPKAAPMDHSKMDHSKMDHSKHGAMATPSTAAFQAANDRMHKDMDIAFSGDADIDFVKGMIPHHQGAIDMAKVVLGFGKDPETRKLAEEIIAAQEKEIALMNAWLKKKGQ